MAQAFGDLRAIRQMLADTVTIEPYTGVDRNGQQTFGTPVTYRARVQGKNRDVITAAGEEKTSIVTVFLGVVPAIITPLDRLTLPARFQPQRPPILAIISSPDEHGVHHVEVAA